MQNEEEKKMEGMQQRTEDELWDALCTVISRQYKETASRDPTKVGQKARVMMAIVNSVVVHGHQSPESYAILWQTHGVKSVERQVADLRTGIALALQGDQNWDLLLCNPGAELGRACGASNRSYANK